jgi:hypothetical protein
VRQAISVGLGGGLGEASAVGDLGIVVAVDAHHVSQPDAAKRASWSVESVRLTAPSMEIWLSSHSTISLLSLKWPASEMASCADAFHQAAVAGEHVGLVVDQPVAEARCQVALGNRHADGVGDALTQRTGGGFDAGGVAVFRVTCGARTDLAEVLQLLDGHVLVAEQVQQRVKQHGAVTGRQDEPVAVRPVRASCGSNLRKCENSTVTISAAPIGRPGWPELAACTASMEIALAIRSCFSREIMTVPPCRVQV